MKRISWLNVAARMLKSLGLYLAIRQSETYKHLRLQGFSRYESVYLTKMEMRINARRFTDLH